MVTDVSGDNPPFRYNAALANQIEAKWQEYWREYKIFSTPNPGQPGFSPTKPKQYVLDMFPFPSGAGLHVGHPRGYIATDIYARYLRMCGYNVLHTMGYDAFGLPAEQVAVETGTHPRQTTETNIAAIRSQLARLGLAHDSERSIATTDVTYYKWTQWIFLQIYNAWYDKARGKARPISELRGEFEHAEGSLEAYPAFAGRSWKDLDEVAQNAVLDSHRLAYLDEVPVNWCPALGTVLANEEVTSEGRSERGNHPVYKRPLRQWMMRITSYADRLIDDLEHLEWPDSIKAIQRNWIGRTEGAFIAFNTAQSGETFQVFTTRPDTLFGATFIVLAPQHDLVKRITTDAHRVEVETYCRQAAIIVDREQIVSKEKLGVFTGSNAIHPLTGEQIPIWVADYVLAEYGTGAVMAVPAHDQCDFEFASETNLLMRAVVLPDDEWLVENGPPDVDLDRYALRDLYRAVPGRFRAAFVDEGTIIQSANELLSLNGLPVREAQHAIVQWLSDKGSGYKGVQYKLRDWLFSRQRYWGEPIPILHGPHGEVYSLRDENLPVVLPELEDFRPIATNDPNAAPTPVLSRAPEGWRILLKDGEQWRRELNTMPQWAGSCWYYLRYLDPQNEHRFCDLAVERYWMKPPAGAEEVGKIGGVDLYVGGVEHAVLHLL
jgi:leucyl-tRNA synthetase